jgi:hypothetical protein
MAFFRGRSNERARWQTTDDERSNNKKSIWQNGFTRIVGYEGGGGCESGTRQREGVTDFADARQSVHDLLRQELNPAWVGEVTYTPCMPQEFKQPQIAFMKVVETTNRELSAG